MKYYAVDVFTDRLFAGNQAGVCLPEKPLGSELMQKIAADNNLSETAFASKRDGHYDLRWFTPTTEIDLCGHATLGTAFVLMRMIEPERTSVDFMTKSGRLTVRRDGETYTMDFPSRKPVPCPKPAGLEEALGVRVLETHQSRDLLALVGSEEEVRDMTPDIRLVKKLKEGFGLIVTAGGKSCDFVSRFFAPKSGIDEDPVTGSSHCTLIPFWSERLGRTAMNARQLSRRGGALLCADRGSRVDIGGTAVLYLEGDIRI